MAQGMVSVLPNHPGDFRVYNYTNIAAATGSAITVIKLGGGVLHGFNVSAAGAAATSQLILLDGTSSGNTAMYTISGTAAATAVLGLDMAFTTALAVQATVTTSTTASATVLWK